MRADMEMAGGQTLKDYMVKNALALAEEVWPTSPSLAPTEIIETGPRAWFVL